MPSYRWAALQIATFSALLGGSSGWLRARPIDIWPGNPCLPAPWGPPVGGFNAAPRPTPTKIRLAQPTAAPPSADRPASPVEAKPQPAPSKPAVSESNPVEPQPRHGVAVREEGPAYDSYPIVLKEKPVNDQLTATFQNLSGRPLKVIVEGRDQELADKQTVTVPVRREFIWRVEGREPQKEQLGKNDYALQIVIRR
jgi:hypothetical protein